jgi:DNA-binding HxlR family transcriptional regulator
MKKSTEQTEPFDNDQICPITYALSFVGQKWKIPILWHLSEHDTLRYNEIKRSVYGITNMMLTKSLQELEGYHLIHRKQYDIIPPRVEYSLTERGRTLIPVLKALDAWGREQIEFNRNMQ